MSIRSYTTKDVREVKDAAANWFGVDITNAEAVIVLKCLQDDNFEHTDGEKLEDYL